jgi:8-amino-7-oxononanoate synthase
MVDDAHGIGVIGEQGRGSLHHCDLGLQDAPVLMATLGKAFGTFGAFVAGSDEFIEYLIQNARTYIYTTAIPPAIAAATRKSLQLVQQESWRREKLQLLIKKFQQGAAQLGLNLLPSDTPIQPLITGSNEQALSISETLYNQGILVSAIRPPTVPANSARLRITFSAQHEESDVDSLLAQLERAT